MHFDEFFRMLFEITNMNLFPFPVEQNAPVPLIKYPTISRLDLFFQLKKKKNLEIMVCFISILRNAFGNKNRNQFMLAISNNIINSEKFVKTHKSLLITHYKIEASKI
jgi:hypothetical protein